MEKKRILVVDDEENFIVMVKLNLELTQKYDVKIISEAKDIVAIVHAFKPDVVLLDLLMPGVGGLDACQFLNEDALGKSIPIIILSALSKDVDKRKAYQLGVVDYLVKPIDAAALISAIDKAIDFKSTKW